MSREQGHEGKADRAKEGDGKPVTSAKVASEGVTDEQQAVRYEKKFTTFSGTSDKKLHAQEFVLEDKEKGVQHTARGERKIGGEKPPEVRQSIFDGLKSLIDKPKNRAEKTEQPRPSFIQGLKALMDSAKSADEFAEKQAAFSISYMMKKAQEFLDAAMGKHSTDASHQRIPPDSTHTKQGPEIPAKDTAHGHPHEAHQIKNKATLVPHRNEVPHKREAHDVPLSEQEVNANAQAIRHVLDDWNLGRLMNSGRPDINAIANILQPLGLLRKNEQHPMKSITDLSPSDRVRAFIVGVGESQESLTNYLQTLSRTEISNMNADYAHDFKGHVLSADLINKLPLEHQSQFRTLVSNVDVPLSEQLNRAQASHDSLSTFADQLTEHLWDRKRLGAQEQMDEMEAAIARYGSNLDAAGKEQLKEKLQAYYKAESDYANSKSGAAKALVDASVSLATMAASLLGPEVTLPFLLASGAGGAVYSIGVTSVVEGKRFKMDTANLVMTGNEGFTAALGGLATPEVFGMKGIFRVTESAANQVASEALRKGTYGALKPDAEKIIARELQKVTEVEAVTNPRAAIEQIASKVTDGGGTNPQLVEALTEKLQDRVRASASHRLEAEQMLRNAGSNAATTFTTDAINNASGFANSDDLIGAMEQSATSGAVMYKVMGIPAALLHSKSAEQHSIPIFVARDFDGRVYVGMGATIQRTDGTRFVVDGPAYALEKNERVCLNLTRHSVETLVVRAHPAELAGSGAKWKRERERFSKDVVQQVHENACMLASAEMLTNGAVKQEDLVKTVRSYWPPEYLAKHPNPRANLGWVAKEMGADWYGGYYRLGPNDSATFAEKLSSLLHTDKPWAAEFKEPGAEAHVVVVDGQTPTGKLMIRDPARRTKYEMTKEEFLKVWNTRVLAKGEAIYGRNPTNSN